jgi:hypothetical protein
MKVGDTVYILRAGALPVDAEVTYAGKGNFTAGGLTFSRSAEGEPFAGSHSRGAKAYLSKDSYLAWREKCDAWHKLRYTVGIQSTPPDNVSAGEINGFIELLKRK